MQTNPSRLVNYQFVPDFDSIHQSFISYSHSVSPSVIDDIVSQIRMHTTEQPYLGIVCGSGLSELVDFIENQTIVPYGSLPAFVSTTGKFDDKLGDHFTMLCAICPQLHS